MNGLTPIRTYTKYEMSLLYDCDTRTLMQWIKDHPVCHRILIQLGYTPTTKRYTPNMVEVIFDCLGNPRTNL